MRDKGWWGMRKQLCTLIGACLALAGSAAPALATKVAVIFSRSMPPYQEALRGFEQSGFTDTAVLNLEGSAANVPVVLKDVAEARPDGVLIFGAEAFNALKAGLPNVPVVYALVLEPLEGPNRTAGVLMQIPVEDQIDRIRRLLPGVRKVGVVYNPAYSLKTINQARQLVDAAQMTLVPIAVESVGEIPSALNKMAESGIDVLWSVVDKTVAQPVAVEQMIKFSLERKVPFIGLSVFHVKAGALAALSVDYADLGQQTGLLAKRVLDGTVSSGKVETPRKVIIYVNGETQRRLGLKNLVQLPEIQMVQ
jgi:putative ABC transport system substrate-binding protein